MGGGVGGHWGGVGWFWEREKGLMWWLARFCRFDTKDGLFDVAWNESHENQLAVASGDGSIKLFDIMVKVGLPWKDNESHRNAFAYSCARTCR